MMDMLLNGFWFTLGAIGDIGVVALSGYLLDEFIRAWEAGKRQREWEQRRKERQEACGKS